MNIKTTMADVTSFLSFVKRWINYSQFPYCDNAPLFQFNEKRDWIKSEVAYRIFNEYLEKAKQLEKGNDKDDNEKEPGIGLMLNRICYSEIDRLRSGKKGPEDEIHPLKWWYELAKNIGTMNATQRRDALQKLIDDYVQDTAGNFNLNVFFLTTQAVPRIVGLLSESDTFQDWSAFEKIMNTLKKAGNIDDLLVFSGYFDRVRKLSKKGTIVLVPTHSSNVDSIMLGWGIHRLGIPPVTYGAGKNLFTNFLTSFFMKNLGAYKVDRRIRNQLYKDLLKMYSQVILEQGFHSLFFPGGTRSRSNFVETNLKLGLLGTTVSAYAENLVKNGKNEKIFLCPITLNYNLVLEAESLIKDFLWREGGYEYFLPNDDFNNKKKVHDFVKATSKLNSPTVMCFGEPLDPFGNVVDEEGVSYDSQGHVIDPSTYIQSSSTGLYTRDSSRDRAYTRRAGEKLADSFLRNCVLQPTNVVAWVLFELIWENGIPNMTVFQMLKMCASKTEIIHWKKFELGVIQLREELIQFEKMNKLKLSEIVATSVKETIDEGLKALQLFHNPPILKFTEKQTIEVERIDLIYFYRNRVASYPIDREKILRNVMSQFN